MKKSNLKSFADSRKLKYGTINIVFIVIVVAIVIMLNSIITVLGDTFGWYLDMTEEHLYTISEPFVELLETASRDVEIDIIFCCDKDEAQKNYTDLEKGGALAYIHSTATQIEEKLDNVSVIYKDPVKDYEFMRRFTLSSSQIKPSQSTVIIARKDANGEYGTFYRTYHASSFYTFAGQTDGSRKLYGYNGERTFATAVLSLTYDKIPTVFFVAGHGEDFPYSKADGNYYVPVLASTLMSCSFNVRYLYLDDTQASCPTSGCAETWGYKEIGALEKISCGDCGGEFEVKSLSFNEERKIPTDARAVIINQPETDYGANETSKLSEYIISSKGTIMCYVNPLGKELGEGEKSPYNNLYSFIKQETGVTVLDGDFITDENSTSLNGGNDIRVNVSGSDAAQVYLGSLNNYGTARPIMDNCAKLEIDERYSNSESGGYNDRAAQRYTLPLLETNASALYNGQAGKHTVMTVTSLTTIKNNEAVYSYFIVGSGGFVADDYLSASMYPNESIVLALVHSTTAAQVPVNLDFKTFENYDLDITASQARGVFISLVAVLPVITAAIGVIVLVRRRNR